MPASSRQPVDTSASRRLAMRLIGAMALCGQSTLAAAEAILFTEEDLLGGLQTVQSVTRLEQRRDQVPTSVTIIDRAMIEASGAVNIADLFRLVPGFQAYHVHANVFGVVSHGQGETYPGRLEVMVDGRSVYLPLLSTVDWSALGIGIQDIDHIEVVRGSNVPTQGSNALLGAINIITRQPLQDQGTALSVTRGALRTQDYYLRHNDRIGKMDYRLSLNFHKNNGTGIGFEDGDPSQPPQSMADGGEISQLDFRGSYTPNLVDSIDLQFGLNGGQFGVGNAADPAELSTRDVDSHYQQLTWSRQLEGGDELRLQGYHHYHHYSNVNQQLASDFFGVSAATILALTGQPDQLIDLGEQDGTTQRLDVELQHAVNFSHDKRLIWGAGLRWEALESAKLIGSDNVEELMGRLFGNYEWTPSRRWTFNVGAMLEHNDLVDSKLSPRLGANFHLSDNLTLRGAVSQSYRTPSLLEQYQFTTLKLPSNGAVLDLTSFTADGLEAERVRSYELGLVHNLPRWGAFVDLKFYLEEVDNVIGDVRSSIAPGIENPAFGNIAFANRNDDNWRTKGFDLELKLQPWQHSWLHLAYGYADADGSYLRRPALTLSENDELFIRDDRVPKHTFSALASHDHGNGLQTSLAYYRQTSVDWFRGSLLPAYKRVDARIAQSFNYGRSEGSIELIVQNLFSNYTEFEVNNDVDTRTFVRFNLNFL